MAWAKWRATEDAGSCNFCNEQRRMVIQVSGSTSTNTLRVRLCSKCFEDVRRAFNARR